MDESVFEFSSSEVDSLAAPDSDPAEPEEQGSANSSEPDSELDEFSSLSDSSFDDSFYEAETFLSSSSDIDNSSFYAAVLQGQRDTITEIQRVQGYSVCILYCLYILIALLISRFIIKMIFHFTSYDR
jgi:hypothetical protein